MAVLPLPNSETMIGDIAKLKAAVAPLHPYLLPSTLTLTTVAGGLFPSSASNIEDHVTSHVSTPNSMILSRSSISSLLSSVQSSRETASSPPQSTETTNKTSESEGVGEEVEVDMQDVSETLDSPTRDPPQEIHCQR